MFFPPSLSTVLHAAAFPLQRQMQFIPMADDICPRALHRAGGWEAPVDPLPSCSAQACAGVSPCQGEGSRFQNLSEVYCHLYRQSGCRPRKTEERSPVGSKQRVGGVPRWQSVSWRLQGWTRAKENILVHDLSLTLTIVSLVLLSSPGTSGISLSHNFYSGSIFKSNSIRTSLSPQRLPPQWLEFTRFYNCGSRVSTNSLFFKALSAWGYWQPLGARGWVNTLLHMGDGRHCCPSCSSNKHRFNGLQGN